MAASFAIHATTVHGSAGVENERGSRCVVLSRASVFTAAPAAFARRIAVTAAATWEGLALRIATRSTVLPSTMGRPFRNTKMRSARAGSDPFTLSFPTDTWAGSTMISGARSSAGGGEEGGSEGGACAAVAGDAAGAVAGAVEAGAPLGWSQPEASTGRTGKSKRARIERGFMAPAWYPTLDAT